MRKLLIKALGGYTKIEMEEAEYQLKQQDSEIQVLTFYKTFVDSIYFYAGSYPAWKAQQEFRQLMAGTGQPLMAPPASKEQDSSWAGTLDAYLGRVVDGFAELRHHVRRFQYHDPLSFWGEDRLPIARGDQYLVGNGETKIHD